MVPPPARPRGFEGLTRSAVPTELIAALTVWAVLVPEALAYATIAGVPPVVGLYAAPAALLLYALFGSSRHLIVGPMAAVSALSAAAVATVTQNPDEAIGLTAVLAIVAGVLAVSAYALRLGFLASFISEPVLKGFIVGLALTIIAGQLPKVLGTESVHGSFVERIWDVATSLGDTHPTTLAVGACSLAALLALRHTLPRAPAPLIVVAGAIAAVTLFDLTDRGVEVVGAIEPGLPSIGVPDAAWSDVLTLAGMAVGIVLVGFAEGLAAAKTYAAKAGYRVDADRELLGLGAANVGAGLTSGMVVAGSLSKTAVNGASGARSQLSGVLVAALTIVTLLFLTGLFEDLPEPTLGAVVIAAVVELIDVRVFRRLYGLYTADLGQIYGRFARADLIGALAALIGVLLFETLAGLFIGIGVSVVVLAYRASRPHVAVLGRDTVEGRWVDVDRHPDARPEQGVVVLRPESGLFYVNADNVHHAILQAVDDDTRAVVLAAEAVPAIDLTAAEMLSGVAAELRDRGIAFAVAGRVGQVRDLLERAGSPDALVHTDTVASAVARLRAPDPESPRPGDPLGPA